MTSKTYDDPVFGTLIHDVADLWHAHTSIVFLDREWEVLLEVKLDLDDGMEPQQHAAFRHFNDNRDDVMRQAEHRLAEYAEEEFPGHLTGGSLEGHVSPTAVYFPYVRPKPTMGILFTVDWDPDHGAAVTFIDGTLAAVGPQDIIL